MKTEKKVVLVAVKLNDYEKIQTGKKDRPKIYA